MPRVWARAAWRGPSGKMTNIKMGWEAFARHMRDNLPTTQLRLCREMRTWSWSVSWWRCINSQRMADLIKRLQFYSAFHCRKQTEITSTTDIIIIISISLKEKRHWKLCWLYLQCVLKILVHFPIHLQARQHHLIAYFLINQKDGVCPPTHYIRALME